MRSKLIVATTAAALMAGTSYAVAQGHSDRSAAAGSPSMSQSQGGEQKGDQKKAAPSGAAQTTQGLSQNAPAPKGAETPSTGKAPSTSGQAPSKASEEPA